MTSAETLYIKPPAPYNFALGVDFTERERSGSKKKNTAAEKISTVFRIGGTPVPAVITSVGTTEKPELKIMTTRLTAREQTMIEEKTAEFLFPHIPLASAYRFMENDAKLRRLKQRFYGFVAPKMADTIYAGIVQAIIQQQIALTVANRITNVLIETFGEKVRFADETLYAFPEPKMIANASVADLRKCGLSARKAEYILGFSNAVATGKFDAEALREDDDDEILKKLTAFKGIGRWTAELVMIACMDRDIVPAGDLGIRNSISKYFFNGVLQSEQTIRAFTEGWGAAARTITLYLIYAYVSGVEAL